MPTLVNDTLNAVFIHIPKSAGSSVTVSLRGDADLVKNEADGWVSGENLPTIKDVIEHNDLMVGRKVSHPNHARAMDVRGSIGADAFDSKYSFTFVRNPFDRIASTYHYIRDNPLNKKSKMTLELGFEQYVVYNCLATPQPQSDWICDLEGNLIVKDVLRVEDMDTAGPDVGRKIFGEPINFGRINTSNNTKLSKSTLWNVVPDWVVELYVTTYAEDFAKTGYAPDVGPFKTADEESPDAKNGAWETLAQYTVRPVIKNDKVSKSLLRRSHRAALKGSKN